MKTLIILVLLSIAIYAQSNIEFVCLNGIKDTTVQQNLLENFNNEYLAAGETEESSIISNAWYKEFKPKALEKINAIVSDSSMLWIDLGCKPNGEVEKILYISKNIPNEELEKALDNLFISFNYPIQLDRKFCQCGSFRFNNK